MGEAVLVNDQLDAGADFVRDFNQYAPVAVAFWISPAESNRWFLYIASDEINDSNVYVAYGEVLRRLSGTRSRSLDPFQVKLISSSAPLAREMKEFRDHYPTKNPTRYDRSFVGGMSVDGAYIYPALSATNPAS